MKVLTDEVIASFKDAARKLTGPKRRAFQAQVTLDYLDGSIWKAERVFGWSHHTVALGLNQGLRTRISRLGTLGKLGLPLLYSQAGEESSAFCSIDRQDHTTSSGTSAP